MTDSLAGPRQRRDHAFAVHVVPEVEVLLRAATSMSGQPADAEDLLQDTLLRAYRGIDAFDGAHSRAWLLTILRNTAANRCRRRRPELLDDPDLTLERLPWAPASGRITPEDIVVGETFDQALDAALAALPEKLRRVVRLVDIDGLSNAQAARLLGIPEGTVTSRLHRARQRLRERLAAAGPGHGDAGCVQPGPSGSRRRAPRNRGSATTGPG